MVTRDWWRTGMDAPEPGTPIVVSVDDVDVAVTSIGDQLIAFDDTCTHRACPLSEGEFDGLTVTCPCHKSQFDLATGTALNGPATEPIRIRAVAIEDGQLLIER